ncbi:MIT domain-containing protein 1-like [Gigantopelta aegis]|uniref:MIT domain-containing protein 1-like n=1 Tax=Gigantopelta aegis TaxID=1735272 RepID=UPI001B888342|nr:MIT domain-containing protein 1-like [Gigantopelta aegis]XP_041358828.1 MIT domain-containing protein 1-like [Gigantopelta aegis]
MTDPTKRAGIEASAISLLKRAVELDMAKRFEEATTCYQEGLHLLMEVLKGTHDEDKKVRYRQKISEYMTRAEELKQHVQHEKEVGKYHEQIQIEAISTGYSYEKLFSRFLDNEVSEIEIEDPYIRATHQIFNLLRFCELVVKSDTKVTKIKLITGCDEESEGQKHKLGQIQKSLKKYNIELEIEYSTTLHDRQIKLNNGWVIKIGRGLDLYKATENNFCIGFCDFELRRCHETTVDIFHSKHIKPQDEQS